MRFSKARIKGYTLVELFVAIAVLGILLTLAIPVYQNFVANNRATTQVNQLVAAINLARSEAVKRHNTVILCASSDGKNCGKQWRDGWLIFVDKQSSGQVDSGDEVLRVYQALPAGDQLTLSSSRSNDYLQMDSSGGTHDHQAGTFTYSSADKKHQFNIVVSPTGRVRVEKDLSAK
jgi:type IV fimbrial biogenesis protein FimT